MANQWRTQVTDVARAQHGQTTFVRSTAEAIRGGFGAHPPGNFYPLRLVLRLFLGDWHYQ